MKKLFALSFLFGINYFVIAQTKDDFVAKLELAHKKADFLSKKAIQFDMVLIFGEKERLKAKITLLTNSSKGLIEYANGSKIIYDGNKVFNSPEMKNGKSIRFDAYTWSYFFLFPYKLSDNGTIWTTYNNIEKDNNKFETKKLSFGSNIGDAPNDWYVTYANNETNLIAKAAYIVTFSSSQEKAEQNPHAIEYLDYKEIDGIFIATKWSFWGWKKDIGLTDKLGNAEITNIKFIDINNQYFIPPANFIEK
jgi:hypothetical protein